MIADVSKTLDGDCFAVQAGRESEFLQIVCILKRFADAVLNAVAGGLASSRDTALRYGLSGDACQIVDFSGMERVVGIGHPRHFAFSGTDIGTGHVFAGSNKILLDQFGRVAACDFLDLFRRVLLGVEADAAFGAAEWQVHNCTFVGHQCGQRHDFIGTDHFTEACAALDRFGVLTVLGAPALEDLIVVGTETHGELKIINAVAGLDLAQ